MNAADFEKVKVRVEDRLESVDVITRLNPVLKGQQHVRMLNDGTWTHPWVYFDSLRNYLLLTCFDIIGQVESEHVTFDAWLRGKRFAEQRANVLGAGISGEDGAGAALRLHQAWLAEFGTKTSFLRFIRNVLPDHLRQQLLDSILLRKIDWSNRQEIETPWSQDAKERALYDMRNQFTHGGKNIGSVTGGLFEENPVLGLHTDSPYYPYRPIAYLGSGTIQTEVMAKLWPPALVVIVKGGLEAIAATTAAWERDRRGSVTDLTQNTNGPKGPL